jgi:hypothetical protein
VNSFSKYWKIQKRSKRDETPRDAFRIDGKQCRS